MLACSLRAAGLLVSALRIQSCSLCSTIPPGCAKGEVMGIWSSETRPGPQELAGEAGEGLVDPLEGPDQNTRFHVFKLPKKQRFACSKRDIKAVFANELDSVSMRPTRSLMLNRRIQRPNFIGPVIATINIHRAAISISRHAVGPDLDLYPVRIDQISRRSGRRIQAGSSAEDEAMAGPRTGQAGDEGIRPR
jgi:hypothetical protein